MSKIFTLYLQAGIYGSVIILLILSLRLFLRKAPRHVLCLLWLLAALRLLIPYQFESRLSLQPDLDNAAAVVQQMQQNPAGQRAPADISVPDGNMAQEDISVSAPVTDSTLPHITQPATGTTTQQTAVPVDPVKVLSVIWLSVAGAAIVYMAVAYAILKFRVREAVRAEDGVMECDRIRGAFLLGYLRPRIYLPFRVSRRDRQFIIAHERAHIARGDNWWKLLGFLCASIHWYNPLVWLSYVLLCRDIELACDERVIRELNTDDRKAYSIALLNCGKSLVGVSVCPVAFGEVSLKTRIKMVLRYRKPGIWITVIAFVLIAAVALCFLTSPTAEALPPAEIPDEIHPATEPTTEATEPATEATEPEMPSETTEHVHAYAVQTVLPTCINGGYDQHTCTCGDTFQDNLTEPIEHDWVQNPKYFDDKYSIAHARICTICNEETWFVENVNQYPNLNFNGIRDEVLAYARSLGFQTVTSGNLSNALSYSSYQPTDRLRSYTGRDWEEYLTDEGIKFVDRAYAYCIANNLVVSEQTVLLTHQQVETRYSNGWLDERRLYTCLYFTQNQPSSSDSGNSDVSDSTLSPETPTEPVGTYKVDKKMPRY